ncbi:MAG: HD domain-containing protein [Bacteroidaceae bacterium]|nr:HD domain-containing protein [Bacteroidaceae bacterium]
MITASLQTYIDEEILPRYEHFDAAHRRDHVMMVIEQSLDLARHHALDEDMALVIAAYHDTGLVEDRKTHHLVSGKIVRQDARLREWFSEEQIETMAQAVEDHRASSDHEPRSLYGRVVAEADRFIDPEKILERMIQYGLDHYPGLDREAHYQRTLDHLHEKYADGGYLKLWFPDSPNVQRLELLRQLIRDEARLRARFEAVYDKLTPNEAPKIISGR